MGVDGMGNLMRNVRCGKVLGSFPVGKAVRLSYQGVGPEEDFGDQWNRYMDTLGAERATTADMLSI